MQAPVVLFVFARPEHTKRTLDALSKNLTADKTDLYVYADAARGAADQCRVSSVREVVGSAKGFRSVTLVQRETNYGLARNIIGGVTDVCSKHGRVIVLEDDIVTGKYFLRHMNDALDIYQDHDNVASISGYSFPTSRDLPETFFSRLCTSWGWATWQRAWDDFEEDGRVLLNSIRALGKTDDFDHYGTYPFTRMLEDWSEGRNDSWAVRWYATNFLNERLTLFPGKTLVENIGYDGSGTHCGRGKDFATTITNQWQPCIEIDIKESKLAAHVIAEFFKERRSRFSARGLLRRVRDRLRMSAKSMIDKGEG